MGTSKNERTNPKNPNENPYAILAEKTNFARPVSEKMLYKKLCATNNIEIKRQNVLFCKIKI